MIRLLLVDDETLVRAGCRMAFEGAADLAVVGEADDGESAIALAVNERPDVVLMDGRMPGINGLEATRRMTADARLAATRMIVFATFEAGWDVFAALRAGATGVLLKDTQADELRAAVRAVARGEAFLAPGVTRQVIADVAMRAGSSSAWQDRIRVLTAREREVVAAVGLGMSNEGIGRLLHMSPATARTHVSRALTKLGLHDRTRLVVLAYEAGLVSAGTVEPDKHPIFACRSRSPSDRGGPP